MNIEINKDIEKYKETVVMGLTAKQLVFSIISVVMGAGIVLVTYKYVGLTASAYIAIPVVAPIAINGFYTYQGMTFRELFIRKMKHLFRNPRIGYVSKESELTIKQIRKDEEIKRKIEAKKKKKKKLKAERKKR
jgi:hypothetical protein